METTLPIPSANGHAPVLNDVDVSSLHPSSSPLSPRGGERAGDRGGGPKTLAGKSQSRLNAVKHGLTACDTIFLTGLDAHNRQAYMDLRMMLRRHYRPATEMERLLCDRMAVNHFRILCLLRLEASAVSTTPSNLKSHFSIVPHLDNFSRYDSRLERQIRNLHNRLVLLIEKRGVTYHKPFSFKE